MSDIVTEIVTELVRDITNWNHIDKLIENVNKEDIASVVLGVEDYQYYSFRPLS